MEKGSQWNGHSSIVILFHHPLAMLCYRLSKPLKPKRVALKNLYSYEVMDQGCFLQENLNTYFLKIMPSMEWKQFPIESKEEPTAPL